MNEQMLKRYKQLASEYISFRSISTIPSAEEINKTVNWLKQLFTVKQFATEIIFGYDNPVVFANKFIDKNIPTILIYDHYDVQPASTEEWKRDPFEILEKNGRLFARGIVDNKGQMLVHLVTVFELLATKKLKYNVKFLIEGNEETGSQTSVNYLKSIKINSNQI